MKKSYPRVQGISIITQLRSCNEDVILRYNIHMSDALLFPKLRWPLELKMERVQDQEVLLIRCPAGISPEPLLLIPSVAPLVACFDGTNSIDSIVTRFIAHGATKEIVEQLADLLDQHCYLESPRFHEANKKMRGEFRNSPVREAALAGAGYPGDETALAFEIDKYLDRTNGFQSKNAGNMIGLVSPHVDYRRGGLCYGHTYNRLVEEQHDLYILIGTSHQYSDLLFHLTRKDFLNPLMTAKCDHKFVDQLAKLYGEDRSFQDEFLHKNEHSLELQLPFLTRVQSTLRIVPILVGSFYRMISSGRYPDQFDEYESFAGSLAECLGDRVRAGQRICFLAGVDMAHVGQAFGDQRRLTPDLMKQIEDRDRIYLEAIEQQDKRKLFDHIAEDRDARRICGFPTMYTVMDVCDRLEMEYTAEVFDYRQAVDYATDCAVTFAGMGIYSSSP